MTEPANSLARYEHLAQIVPINQDEGQMMVNARDLYKYLEVNTRFPMWIQRRLEELDALEGDDFIPILGKRVAGRPTSEYMVTLDLAKEMAMLERNDKGREVRRYFIAVEKEFRAQAAQLPTLPSDPLQLFRLTLEALEHNQTRLTALEQHTQGLEQRLDNSPISVDGQKAGHLHSLLKELAQVMGGNYSLAYGSFKHHFGLGKYDQLPMHKYDEAVSRVRGWIETARRNQGALLN